MALLGLKGLTQKQLKRSLSLSELATVLSGISPRASLPKSKMFSTDLPWLNKYIFSSCDFLPIRDFSLTSV